MVLLVTSDNVHITVDKDVAERSAILKPFAESADTGGSNEPVPVPVISSTILRKVLEYCEHHRGEPLDPHEPDNWDNQYISSLDKKMLFDVILAANYLETKQLLDLGCKEVANRIRGKTPKEIRELFEVINVYTPEEQAQIGKGM